MNNQLKKTVLKALLDSQKTYEKIRDLQKKNGYAEQANVTDVTVIHLKGIISKVEATIQESPLKKPTKAKSPNAKKKESKK